ncbi:MAG: GNAT family N-acetyltransferase [Oscillospiraceae bacterium]|nr:GNAT family N-acetyltransferase [Oscillospiraceae bacterium]
MNIRRAENGDIPGMIALLHQVGDVHHRIRPDLFREGALKYDEAALETLLRKEDMPVFVAVKGGFVAGYCFCQIRKIADSSVLTDRRELYIDDLCVDEGCRGQGIASKLYAHVTAFAKKQRCGYITLNVWCGNDSAMRFYEKAGLSPRNITMEMKLC